MYKYVIVYYVYTIHMYTVCMPRCICNYVYRCIPVKCIYANISICTAKLNWEPVPTLLLVLSQSLSAKLIDPDCSPSISCNGIIIIIIMNNNNNNNNNNLVW